MIALWTRRMAFQRAVTLPSVIALIFLVSGCTMGPKYARPAVPEPPAYRGPDDQPVTSQSNGSLGDEQWSAVFREPELQALIRTALADNYDVRIAAERILEQQAQVKITRSQEFPQISAGGTGIGASLPNSIATETGTTGSFANPLSFGSLNLSAAWTPDFWGFYRKQTEEARDQLLAQVWAQRAVRLSLVQQVATTYIQLRALDQQLAVAKSTLEAREDSVKLTQTLADGGAAPLSDLRQAEELLYTATSQIPQIEQQIQQTENQMRLLLGQSPGPVAHTDDTALTPPPENVPTGVPSQLLERRPDIQQAEAQLKAANAQISVARAQFFPMLAISASAGVGGDSFSNLFDLSSRTIYGIGTLTQPIFTGGKLRGQLQLSEHQKEELVLTYQKTIQGAFRDVSNALIAAEKQRRSREEQQKLVEAAQDATRLARVRYQGGATSYLEVLTNDTSLFTAQLNLISAQQSEALTLVQLYAALGGGWSQ
jgi:multidrug efflux system outer membrane protein